MSVRSEIIETVNKLFIYTDEKQWDKLCEEIFDKEVFLDMSSIKGETGLKTAREICNIWEDEFKEIDEVYHLVGNYIVETERNGATVFAYATATHYKATATQGKTREFKGSYNLHIVLNANGWRIDQLKYNLKFVNGNQNLD